MGFVVCLPLLSALVAALAVVGAGWNRVTAWATPLAGTMTVIAGAVVATNVVEHGPFRSLGGVVRVDSLSALTLLLIGAVTTITATCGAGTITAEVTTGLTTPRRARLYGTLVPITMAAMTIVVTTDNLGVMWVAIEATTIATVLLVGHRRDRLAVEAAWKYLVLGSVGVATALLGTVVIYFVARHAGIASTHALDWSTLTATTTRLDPDALRLGVGLVVVGYGTKAGLAPLHSWLPDAYSQAPGPVAGLMAGVVSTMSMYALLRFKVIADLNLGPAYVRNLLFTAAIASLVTAASLIITQRDVRRLLAYSSVEHMGLVAFAAAIGSPLATSAALLHLVGNGLAKSVTFTVTGEITHRAGTAGIGQLRGLLQRDPLTGTVFVLGVVALLGLPPFSILASEVALVRAGIAAGHTWLVLIALAVMMVIFTAIIVHALDMTTGPQLPDAATPATRVDGPTRAVWTIGLTTAAVLGITIWPISRLLHAAAQVLTP